MEQNIKLLEKALEEIELTEYETQFVKWMSGWDFWTIDQFLHIIKKCLAFKN